MALIGGGGAGNTVGSNPAGVGTGLNIVRTNEGSFGYAYSGRIASNANLDVTLLQFSTGSYNSVLNFATDYSSNSGNDAVWKISFNGERVSSFYSNGGVTVPTNRAPFELIIPAYTNVLIEAVNQTNTETIYYYARVTGRIYD